MPFTDITDYSFHTSWNSIEAVYGVMNSQRQMIYIGETNDLKRRMAEHQADSTHCMHRYAPSLVWIERNTGDLARSQLETALIAEYRPSCNQQVLCLD